MSSEPASAGQLSASTPVATTTTIGRLSAYVTPSCSHAGGKVTLTVTFAQPMAYVIFDTVYADGTDDGSSHYGTGSGKGRADASGTFSTSWALASTVPSGPATINIASSDGTGFHEGKATFTVEPITGPCR